MVLIRIGNESIIIGSNAKKIDCLHTMELIKIVVISGFLSTGITSLPVPKGSNFPSVPSVEALDFMKHYGYLEKTTEDAEALFSEEAISEAVKSLQKFGAIEQTGKLDNKTLELMKSPRCGVADVIKNKRSKRFILGSKGWNKRKITYFLANWSPKLQEDSVAKNIQLALDAWGNYGRLNFTRSYDPSADIIVAFGRGYHGDRYPFDGPGNILAHAYFPYELDSFGGDIHFDDDEKWTTDSKEDSESFDFFTVAVHELGHSLGLAHSPVPTSIMFPYYKGQSYSENFALDYDDILAMYQLYIRDGPPESGEYVPAPRPTTSTTTSSTESVFDYDDDIEESTIKITTRRTEIATTSSERTTRWDTSTVTYIGDDETVEDHQKHEPTQSTTTTAPYPDICEGDFDSVSTLRDELFFFKGQYVWRLLQRHVIEEGYPVTIYQMFPNLPKTIKRIDAAYERPDGNIVFFTGKNYWVYNGESFIENSPQPITNYGLPDVIDSIDAVQVWGKNGKTYLYKNDRFWRYNETIREIDHGYPRHMEKWRGVPHNLDAATTWKDGSTYFFKGKLFWKFDNDWVIVTDSSPLPAPQIWLGCPEKEDIRAYFS